MSAQTIRILIAGALLVHGIGHTMGFWMPARSWLLNGIPEETRRTISSVLWILSTAGFLAACMGFLGILFPIAWWPAIAAGASIISLTGLVIFLGNWPIINTAGALGMNLLVLVSLVFIQWMPIR